MTMIATIAGIDAAFGARWDDVRDGARIKAKVGDSVGWYDGKEVRKDLAVAPSLVHAMLDIKDPLSVYAVFFRDDNEEVFASAIFAGGSISAMTEVIYDDMTEWQNAITRTTRDTNIDMVYLPKDAQTFQDEKHVLYSVTDDLEMDDVALTNSNMSLGTAAIVAAMALTVSAIPIGAWIYLAKPFEQKVEEAIFVTEKNKPNFSAIMEKCAADLSVPWPSSPEWTLVQEGCVSDPSAAQVTFPKPVGHEPYSYRYFELKGSQWDDYLSRKAFHKMAERFPGQILEGANQVVLYVPYTLAEERVDNGYTANTDPLSIIERKFVGVMDIASNSGVGGSSASTDLGFQKTIDRLLEERLTIPHISWNYLNSKTFLQFGPEIVNTRQIRVN